MDVGAIRALIIKRLEETRRTRVPHGPVRDLEHVSRQARLCALGELLADMAEVAP